MYPAEFIASLFPEVAPDLSIVIWALNGKLSSWCSDPVEAAAVVEEQIHKSDIYIGVAQQNKTEAIAEAMRRRTDLKTISDTSIRGFNSTAGAIGGLWADIDIKGATHKETRLPATAGEAVELAISMGLHPTWIVKTGGGIQCWWMFKELWVFESPEERIKAARLATSWTRMAQARGKASGWVIDSTNDLARVLRVPGTYNRKPALGKPVEITAEVNEDLRYNPSDFEQYIEPAILEASARVMTPKADATPDDIASAIACLGYLSKDRCNNYEDWLKVGFVLHSLDPGEGMMDLWDQWSQRSPSYDPEAIPRKWSSFHDRPVGGVTLGSMIHWAREDSGMSQEQVTGRDDESFGKPASGGNGNGKPAAQPAATKSEPRPAPSAAVIPPARRIVSNIRDSRRKIEGSEDDEPVKYYKPLPRFSGDVQDATEGWPKRASGLMFYSKPTRESLPDHTCIQWLTTADKFFGWLSGICDVRWAGGDVLHEATKAKLNPPSKREAYEFMADNSGESFESVELLPHHPPIPTLFYVPCRLPDISGREDTALRRLVGALNPETELDRQLMLAALITPGWGGEPGTRPAFVFTSDHGRGVGKTATAMAFADVWGGAITVGAREDADMIRKRLLGDESLSKRVILIDNIKGRMSDGDIEGMITMPTLDGWKPYHGQASRPNLLTWYMTANTPSLSSDLSDRSIVIKVGAPKHHDNFIQWARDHVREHRPEILAEVFSILRDQPLSVISRENRDRWGSWQDGVLSRFAEGDEIAAEYKARRGAVNCDLEDADDIYDSVIRLVSTHFAGWDRKRIHITYQQLYEQLVTDKVCEQGFGYRKTVSWVKGKVGTGKLSCLTEYRLEDRRGWMFCGEHMPAMAPIERLVT